MTTAHPPEGISLGADYDDRHEIVRLPADPLPGHTFILGHAGAGTEHILAKVATHRSAIGRPTAILDPVANIHHALPHDTNIHQIEMSRIGALTEIDDIIQQGGVLLLHARYPRPSRTEMTHIAEHTIRNLQTAQERLQTPALLIADQYQIFEDITWNRWTDRTQNGGIHTMVTTNHPPTSLIKGPIPIIANADAIILRTTSDKNLVPVLDNSDIDGDLTLLTDYRKSFGVGYLRLRDAKWSAYFTDQPG